MIVRKSAGEIETMHHAGMIVWQILQELRGQVKPGVTTLDLENLAAQRTAESGARPAFKGYRGYPCVLCASVNQEVVHGIPSASRRLKEGDIISLDYGCEYKGYYADAAVTVPVGGVCPEVEKLMRVTRESLDRAIDKVRPGNRLGDVSSAVQQWVEENGFAIVREFVGHGIGTRMHEEPNVPNFGQAGSGPRLEEGMVFAIEPMVNAGAAGVKVLDDHWTAVTTDGSFSAHYEHTVAVTADGPWILTRPREVSGPSW
jgi:methionyl aminopeptidase